MLKGLDAKMEAPIRIAALEEFRDDFDCLGDLVADTFDTVQVKLGFLGGGTPTNVICKATRESLAAVKLMIATGKEPPDEIKSSYGSNPLSEQILSDQIWINRNIRDLANAYLDRAEADFADRMLEVVQAIKATVQPERIQKIETVETRIAESLTNPVWSEYLLEVKYAPVGMKMLGFQLVALGDDYQHCSDCCDIIEGYQLKAEKFSYIRWRCTNPGCLRSGSIQAEEMAL